jgi:hypothetical protein
MKYFAALFNIFFLITISTAFAGEIALSGNYYGNNLVVVNPTFGDGFCVTEVLVNNKPTQDEIRSNSFEIDFSLLNLKTGDPVTIVIKYHDGCAPSVINPQALKGDQKFSFTAVKFDRSGKLNWSVIGALGEDPFIIEQYRWNKWSQVGEIGVDDTIRNNTYSFDPIVHTGINQFRVLRIDAFGNPVYSKIIKYNNVRAVPVELTSTKITDKIIFSVETIYELFDEKGNYLTGGYGKEIEATDLEKGKYFLNYDVKSVVITKK